MKKNPKKEVVISVKNVSKDFVLPHEKKNSVKSIFTSSFRNKGKSTKQSALKNISVDIKKGEFFGIVGRNGSGKSTLLKIIAEIYQPTKGSVSVKGKLVPFIELGVGFNSELTGRENVYLNGAIMGHTTALTDKNYNNIVKFAELEEFMDKKLKNYSSGMQVRLAFACATKSKADILLVDEVLAVGDTDFQRKCFNYFRHLKRQNVTVVFVTHDMNAVREYCDRAMIIEGSKIVYTGKPDAAAQKYEELFTESAETDKISITNESKRWGKGEIQYTTVKTHIDKKRDLIKIKCSLKSNVKTTTECFFGFRIKNGAGADVCGTNTKLVGRKNVNLKPGVEYSFEWIIPNILADGSYAVINSITQANGTTQDYIHSDDLITIKKNIITGYLTQPTIKFIKES